MKNANIRLISIIEYYEYYNLIRSDYQNNQTLYNNYLPIKPITEFIRYLNNVDKPPFTVKSYAHHLKLFWDFLDSKQLDWTKISLSNLAAFVGWLRELKDDSAIIDITEDRSARKPATINVILAAYQAFTVIITNWVILM